MGNHPFWRRLEPIAPENVFEPGRVSRPRRQLRGAHDAREEVYDGVPIFRSPDGPPGGAVTAGLDYYTGPRLDQVPGRFLTDGGGDALEERFTK